MRKWFQIWIPSGTEQIQPSKNIKYYQSIWEKTRAISYQSSPLLHLTFLSLISIQHDCVVSRICLSWVSWLIWPTLQDISHILQLTRHKEPPSFIGFHKHLLLEGIKLKFVFPWILVCVFSEVDRIARLKGLQGSRKDRVLATGNWASSRNPVLLWGSGLQEGLSHLPHIWKVFLI